MLSPRFDPVLAINQFVQALFTLGAATSGGYFAFRLALRNVRNAKAIDRRLEWGEKLHDALAGFQSSIGALIGFVKLEEIYPQLRGDDRLVVGKLVEETRAAGGNVVALLKRAELYWPSAERETIEEIAHMVETLTVLMVVFRKDEQLEADALRRIETVLPHIEDSRLRFVSQIRRELGLERSREVVPGESSD